MDLAWHYSVIRPAGAVWWTWVVSVVIFNCGLGAYLGWLTTQLVAGEKRTFRESVALAGAFFLAQMCNSTALETLGGTVGRWLWGLVVTSMSLGFFVSRGMQACRSTEVSAR